MVNRAETLKNIEDIQEAVKDFNRMEVPRFIKEQVNKILEPNMLMIKYVHRCLTKYRWHDLRKNPNDLLPLECVQVLVMKYDGMVYAEDPLMIRTWIRLDAENFIAWKEIEPFEVRE